MTPTIINLTPHDITVVGVTGETIATFPPSGSVARVHVTIEETPLVAVLGVPTTRSTSGHVTGLPAEQTGVRNKTTCTCTSRPTATRD